MCQSVCSYTVTCTANYVEYLFPCLRGATPNFEFPLDQECDGVQNPFCEPHLRCISTTSALRSMWCVSDIAIMLTRTSSGLEILSSKTSISAAISAVGTSDYLSPSPQIRACRNNTTLKMTTMRWLSRSNHLTLTESTSDGMRVMEL